MIGWFIVAAEVGFWVFVISGLFFRYLLKLKRLGGFLLLSTPLIDLLLIIVTVMDIKNGATANTFHGLAAIYIGVTIVYGHRMIKWADERFAYWLAGGAKPKKGPKYGSEHARIERIGWFRHLLAWFIGCSLLYLMVWSIGEPSRTENLLSLIKTWTMILIIDFIISFSYTIWPKKEKANM
ncbi:MULTISPECIES: hypothetical protein [Neobacillus]|jgi:hypothetical protein|uniref:2TM domain-containing protein n=1 Tax=Neobacillus sedimentimangrovi TaxID=2699460 RepID=A0ABS8QLF4_9BACI|nr:hypothetical protein [Neobacillus sedimentimangrovi]AIM16638.1 membrane protein [Bacillus sp. X1(2014)]MCD4840090.1 hypothetical protein [Neobacillus sedimentimangrovi]